MDFKQLQSFVCVVQNQSFTKASELLYISQPTISSHIRQLEEELHVRLIIRTTKSMEITPKGRELFEYAVHILELRDQMIQSCSNEKEPIIRLGASTIPSAYILPKLLPKFAAQHPDIYFTIHQSNSYGIIEKLKEGVFDLGLIGMQAEDDALTCVPFCEDHMIMITPVNEHFLKLKQQEDLDVLSLLKEPIILREKKSGSQKSADHFLQKLNISEEELNISARVNDQEAIKNLVAEGVGISIISMRAAENYLAEKRLIGFELPGDSAVRKLYLVYQKHYILKSHAKAFVEFVLRYHGFLSRHQR